jgi:hypothetical protein
MYAHGSYLASQHIVLMLQVFNLLKEPEGKEEHQRQ